MSENYDEADILAGESDVLAPPFRAHYAQLAEPQGFRDGTPKYSVLAVWSQAVFNGAEGAELRAALEAISQSTWRKPYAKLPSTYRKPLYPGTDKPTICADDEVFANLKANVSHPAQIVDEDNQVLEDAAEIIAAFPNGCTARAVVNVYAWNRENSKGIGIGLIAIQVTDRTTAAPPVPREAHSAFGAVPRAEGSAPATPADDSDFDDDIPF